MVRVRVLLLSAICRLIRFDNGEVKIDGQLMSDYKNNDLSKKYLY